jgi:hypothetical protein
MTGPRGAESQAARPPRHPAHLGKPAPESPTTQVWGFDPPPTPGDSAGITRRARSTPEQA